MIVANKRVQLRPTDLRERNLSTAFSPADVALARWFSPPLVSLREQEKKKKRAYFEDQRHLWNQVSMRNAVASERID
jgi:hypothetical protein